VPEKVAPTLMLPPLWLAVAKKRSPPVPSVHETLA
jgi:hypothetical protein